MQHGGGAEQRVSCKVEFAREVEDVRLESVRLACRSDEDRLELSQLAGERLHQLGIERLLVE